MKSDNFIRLHYLGSKEWSRPLFGSLVESILIFLRPSHILAWSGTHIFGTCVRNLLSLVLRYLTMAPPSLPSHCGLVRGGVEVDPDPDKGATLH